MGRLKLGILVGVLLGAFSAPTNASTIQFTGTTTGEFTTTGFPTLFGLEFFNGSFDVTTDATGFAAIGGVVTDNLGQFALVPTDDTYTGEQFTLDVVFVLPPGVSPNPSSFSATLLGSVTSDGDGGVVVDFANNLGNPLFLTYAAGGSFNLSVNDLSITPGQTLYVSGQISQASVPEGGSTVAFLGLGLMVVAMAGRKFLV